MAPARRPSSVAIISSRPRTADSSESHSLRSRPTSSARRSAWRLFQRVRNARSLTMQIAAAWDRVTSESIRSTAWLSHSSSVSGTPYRAFARKASMVACMPETKSSSCHEGAQTSPL
jgi:hypothetical protein